MGRIAGQGHQMEEGGRDASGQIPVGVVGGFDQPTGEPPFSRKLEVIAQGVVATEFRGPEPTRGRGGGEQEHADRDRPGEGHGAGWLKTKRFVHPPAPQGSQDSSEQNRGGDHQQDPGDRFPAAAEEMQIGEGRVENDQDRRPDRSANPEAETRGVGPARHQREESVSQGDGGRQPEEGGPAPAGDQDEGIESSDRLHGGNQGSEQEDHRHHDGQPEDRGCRNSVSRSGWIGGGHPRRVPPWSDHSGLARGSPSLSVSLGGSV